MPGSISAMRPSERMTSIFSRLFEYISSAETMLPSTAPLRVIDPWNWLNRSTSSAVGVPAPGLVVMYDLASLPASELARLVQRRPGQVVFAHAAPWTADSPVAPEVITLLYQQLVPPWGAHLMLDPDSREVSRAAADERAVDELAAELAASPGLDDGELTAEQLERWAALCTRVWPLAPGRRSRLWAGGPVPSGRF